MERRNEDIERTEADELPDVERQSLSPNDAADETPLLDDTPAEEQNAPPAQQRASAPASCTSSSCNRRNGRTGNTLPVLPKGVTVSSNAAVVREGDGRR